MYSKKTKKKLAAYLKQLGMLLAKGEELTRMLMACERETVRVYERMVDDVNRMFDKAANKYVSDCLSSVYLEIQEAIEASYSRVDLNDGVPFDWLQAQENLRRMRVLVGKLEKFEARDIRALERDRAEQRKAKKRERAEKLKAQRAAQRAAQATGGQSAAQATDG
jgi:hypothetical protein